MDKPYREMTRRELEAELERLRREGQRALEEGLMNKVDLLERKFYVAKSHLITEPPVTSGETAQVIDHDAPFHVTRYNGIMAWGTFDGDHEEQAFPAAMLSAWRTGKAE